MLSFTSVQRERDQTSKQDVLKNAIRSLLKKANYSSERLSRLKTQICLCACAFMPLGLYFLLFCVFPPTRVCVSFVLAA